MTPNTTAPDRIGTASPQVPVRVRVRMATDLGDIVVELDSARAPRTVAAFLEQVDRGAYDGGSFGRIVRADNDRGSPTIEVIQASCASGIEQRADVPLETTDETGLRHDDGTLSLPRSAGGHGSAQSFFLCIGCQPALDKGGGRIADGLGFAAFGRVIEGMDTARAIHRIKTVEDAPTDYLRGQLAADPVVIRRMARDSQAARPPVMSC